MDYTSLEKKIRAHNILYHKKGLEDEVTRAWPFIPIRIYLANLKLAHESRIILTKNSIVALTVNEKNIPKK